MSAPLLVHVHVRADPRMQSATIATNRIDFWAGPQPDIPHTHASQIYTHNTIACAARVMHIPYDLCTSLVYTHVDMLCTKQTMLCCAFFLSVLVACVLPVVYVLLCVHRRRRLTNETKRRPASRYARVASAQNRFSMLLRRPLDSHTYTHTQASVHGINHKFMHSSMASLQQVYTSNV